MAQGNNDFGVDAPPFEFGEILLYRLQITVGSWSFAYVTGSGSYTSYASIGDFISDLQDGDLPAPDGHLPPFGSTGAPPDLIVRMPCFVVVVLSSPDQPSLCFQLPPMTTGADCSSKYFDLTETCLDSLGAPTVAFFTVPVVQPASLRVADPYTLYVQYTSNGSTITHTIDPCIRNQGPG